MRPAPSNYTTTHGKSAHPQQNETPDQENDASAVVQPSPRTNIGTEYSDENMSPTIATSEVRNETPSNVSIPSTIVTGTPANVTNLSAIELRRKRDREVYASLSAVVVHS
uniref:Uncharacterized protein n=2 Tax=Oryza TaxID=4527 RepID=Q2QLZ9_ORYSJ|nr:hypothetical protein LOC_Os12g42770 [Oryza sativa Japonica Group]